MLAPDAQEDRDQVLQLAISNARLDKRTLFNCSCLSQDTQRLVHNDVRRRLPDYLPTFLSPGCGSNDCVRRHTYRDNTVCYRASQSTKWLCRAAGPGAASSASAARALLLDTHERANPESIEAVIASGAPCGNRNLSYWTHFMHAEPEMYPAHSMANEQLACFACAGLTVPEALIIQAAKQRSPNMQQIIEGLLPLKRLKLGTTPKWLFGPHHGDGACGSPGGSPASDIQLDRQVC